MCGRLWKTKAENGKTKIENGENRPGGYVERVVAGAVSLAGFEDLGVAEIGELGDDCAASELEATGATGAVETPGADFVTFADAA